MHITARAIPPSAPASMSPDGPISILIVDDEPKNLTVLETVLDAPGYRLVRAESADAALLALVMEEFALLILDIRMPDMTGFELAQMIKERKKTAQVPIIFLTAYDDEDQHVLEGYGTGAVDYLHKPVNAAVLRSKVAVFAELYRTQREIAAANRALLGEVTERRRAVEQLRELNDTLEQRVAERTEALHDLNRRKDEFLAMLGHELRNPLAPIVSAVRVLRRPENGRAPRQHAVAVIERQAQQLARLVDGLLDVARITSGRIWLQREPLEPNDIVHHAVETVRPLLDARRHTLTVSLSPQPMWLNADAARLEQVVVNLLDNAVKYTGDGGQIWLTVEQEGDECVLRVRDTGVGIAPELLPRAFDTFTQGERSADRAQGGLGIGLALVRGIVEAHQGRVEASSTLGQGSEFVVRLPVTATPAPPASSARQATPAPAGPPLRVLVVDDNVDAVDMLKMLLETSGHDVLTAHDGPSSLQAAHQYRPNVVLLDIGLPGLDGYAVARKIREQAIFKDVMLVATTGYGQECDRQRSQEAGFDHHMVKPYDFDRLEQILAAVPAHTYPID